MGLKMRVAGYALIWLILASCSAQWHVRQAIKKGAFVKSDTVYTDRVVITPGDSTTVFVPLTMVKDSLITVYQDRIKISYKTIHDTLRFHVECPPDSVFIRVPVSVNTEVNCPPRSPFWRNLALALIVVTCLVLYFRRS